MPGRREETLLKKGFLPPPPNPLLPPSQDFRSYRIPHLRRENERYLLGIVFPCQRYPLFRVGADHICGGPGGRLPHRAGSRGGSPLPPEAPSQTFRAGIGRMGRPLAAGGYPIPSRFLPLCMAALAPGAASRLRLAPRRALPNPAGKRRISDTGCCGCRQKQVHHSG